MKILFNKKILIVVLIIIAIILGFAVVKKNLKGKVGSYNNDTQYQNQNGDSQSPITGSPPTGGLPPPDRVYPRELRDQEKAVLNPPYTGTKEEQDRHFQLTINEAEDSNTIDIAGCLGEPLVARISLKEDLKVKNSDSVERRIVFDEETFFVIPPESEEIIKDLFSRGTGLYGYGCDQEYGVSGFFLVTE